VRAVHEVLDRLEAAGIVSARADDERLGAFQLGRAAETVRVADVLAALRGPRDGRLGSDAVALVVEKELAELDACQRATGERDTLADLVGRCGST
jgi:DNA-binding IscR family transcriptional regulator